MSASVIPLDHHLATFVPRSADADPVVRALSRIGFVAKAISQEMRRAALVGNLGLVGEWNASEDPQKKLDLKANELVLTAFGDAELAGGRATDGRRRILDLKPESLHARSELAIGSAEHVVRLEECVMDDPHQSDRSGEDA